ncbi:MAG: hypothetical protein AAFP90_06340 [Planctomycetota bacterium]
MTSHTYLRDPQTNPRDGLSIMEVLFAIGVLTIGLVGLAHVLPVGIRQSTDALQRDETLAAMENLVSETTARIASSQRIVNVPVVRAGPWVNNANLNAQTYRPLNVGQLFLASGPTAVNNFGNNQFFPGPSSSWYVEGPVYHNGVCVDPWFLASADNRRAPTTDRNQYDRTRFPCYDPFANPLISAASNIRTAPWQFNTNTAEPVGGPRLLRVSLSSGSSRSSVVNNERNVVSSPPRGVVEQFASAQSQRIPLVRPSDDSYLPGARFTSDSGNLVGRQLINTYTAFALAQPDANDNAMTRVTTLVSRSRNVVINEGATGANRFPLSPYTVDRNNPLYGDEILTYVSDVAAGGFIDGLGGEVVITVAADAPRTLREGTWVMLMRQPYTMTVNNGPNPPLAVRGGGPVTRDGGPQYAFYQISDVAIEPTDATVNDPIHNVNRACWQARIRLEGPDWLFDDNIRASAAGVYSAANADGTSAVHDNTFAVILPNVVAVFERRIAL